MTRTNYLNQIPEGIVLTNKGFELDEKFINTNVDKSSPLLIGNTVKNTHIEIESTEEQEALYPFNVNEEKEKQREEDELKALQDAIEDEGGMLPTEMNVRNERKYAPDEGTDNNILLPYTE
jgi:hypothetical protein